MRLVDIVNNNNELTEYNKKEIIDNTLSFDFKKSNTFTIKCKFDFTSVEQNILNYIFYKFNDVYAEKSKYSDNIYHKLKLNIRDMFSIFGYANNKGNYDLIKQSIKDMSDKSIWLTQHNPDTREEISDLFRIMDTVRTYTKKNDNNDIEKGNIIITFSEFAYKLFSSDLQEFYTTYNFAIVFGIKGKYAKRLYDLFYYFIHKAEKSGNVKERYEFNISYERFCNLLGVDMRYCNSSQLKQKVIVPALKEINNNNMCNMNIEYILDKKKKNITFLFSKGNVLQREIRLNEIANNLIKQVKDKTIEQNEHLENEYTLFDYIDSNNVMHLKKE